MDGFFVAKFKKVSNKFTVSAKDQDEETVVEGNAWAAASGLDMDGKVHGMKTKEQEQDVKFDDDADALLIKEALEKRKKKK
jgi:hypothetical protein